MEVASIKADEGKIIFEFTENLDQKEVTIREYIPGMIANKNYWTTKEKKEVKDIYIDIDSHSIQLSNINSISITRYEEGIDRISSQFVIEIDKTRVKGAMYVTDAAEAGRWKYDYPQPDTIKALAAEGEDLEILGIKQSLVNINLPAIMTVDPKEEVIPFKRNGKTYYFIKNEIEKLDEYMVKTYHYGAVVTGILLNAPTLFDSKEEQKLLDKVVHPNYDWQSDFTYISAFNMCTCEGQDYYCAFVEFLAERYAREDAKYGRMCGMIISNEVNSQYIWGNAGEMCISDYVREYTLAMRLAWISARKYYSNFRIYVSLDHFWNLTFDTYFEKKYYKGRDVIDYINQYSKEEGDFDWNIAYHPYPENLAYPDFYNDRCPTFDFSTPRITLKNIEMLPAYLSQDKLLYQGTPRRIILSEQGFNSKGDSFSEKQGAAAYCLAYQKLKKLDTIDLFTHHAYVDNPYEFGLNLGIRRRNADGTLGEPKPIYYVMRDMNTEMEEQKIQESRTFIGEKLFDSLLNPSITYGEADKSKETEFQNSNKDGK